MKFKETRAPWPASRLSCSHPLHGRMHLPGDYLHRLIAVSIKRKRRNFFASYKDAAVSEAERKKGQEKERRGGKSEQDRKGVCRILLSTTQWSRKSFDRCDCFFVQMQKKTNL